MELSELIDGCYKGSREHQEALYRKYAPKMYGVCMTYAKNRDTANDILHDGFFKIFRKFHQFDSKKNLEVWIRSVMVNTAIDHLRKIAKFRMVELETKHESLNSSNNVFERLKTQDLLNFINKLPAGARAVFNLYTLEGFTHKEIAAKLEINEGTSKSQYSRARSLLRNMIEADYGGARR